MPSTWKALPISDLQGDQHYIARFDFQSSSYTIEVSDLCSIWAESLDRREIVKRALNEDTSIDPSEDASQLRILLQKIEAALRGDDGTRLSITRQKNTGSLQLDVTSSLPQPLTPLTWIVRLNNVALEGIRSEIIFPLLEVNHAQKLETNSLIATLGSKDNIISRLLDKLEATGADLGGVFPQAAASRSSKKVRREDAAAHVKGLGPFDEQAWRTELRSKPQEALHWMQQIESAFGDGLPGPRPSSAYASQPFRIQPRTLQHEQSSESFEYQPAPRKVKEEPLSQPSEEPSHQAISTSSPAAVPPAQTPLSEDDEGTADRASPFAPIHSRTAAEVAHPPALPTKPPPPNPPPNAAPAKRKLGTIGGRKQATSSDTPRSPPAAPPANAPTPTLTPTPAPAPSPAPPAQPAPRKLGRISGGGSSSSSTASSTARGPSPSSPRPSPPPPAAPRNSTIASETAATAADPPPTRHTDATTAPETGPERRGRETQHHALADEDAAAAAAAAAAVARETSRERADRKRAKLRREMDGWKRGAEGGGRKKRRF